MSHPKVLIDGVRRILLEVRASLSDENVQDAIELLDHAEWGEAFSLICTQLSEYDVAVSKHLYDRIEWIGEQMGMPPSEWTIVKDLVES